MRTSKYILSIALCMSVQTFVSASEIHNWTSASGAVWRDASGRCWRDASWTPATAAPNCDGAVQATLEAQVVAKPVPAPTPAAAPAVTAAATPAPAPAATPAPAPVVAAAAPVAAPEPVKTQTITLGANALFDTNKSVLKDAGKAKLNALAIQLNGMNSTSIVATGYTDSTGSDALNQKLSASRAEAVKAYLVAQGVAGNKIQAVGKGSANPVADNKTSAGRAQNRRVVIEALAAKTLK